MNGRRLKRSDGRQTSHKNEGHSDMHELGLTQNILKTAVKYAGETHAKKVITIVLRLGELRDIKPEWISRYFKYISRGTLAEGAEILILRDPIVCRCVDCKKDFEIDLERYAGENIFCPFCFKPDYTLISGTAFQIEGIEVTA